MPSDFAPHNMTSNTAPSPYVASASTYYPGAFLAFRPFDGGVGTDQYWLANGNTGWVKLDIGEGNQSLLDNYSIRVNTIPEPTRAPKAWTMEGSNNDSDWDVLDTVTNQTAWSSGETRNFSCDVIAGYYRYFRLNITENNGDTYLQVAELYLYGDAPLPYHNYLKSRFRNRLDMGGYSLGQT